MLQRVIQILFHALPVLPLVLDRRPGIVGAAILLVVMPYIKVKKLSAQIVDADQEGLTLRSADLRKALERWKYLTFI